MQRQTQQRILQERDFQGRPLKPLARSTVARKRAAGQSPYILRARGILFASFGYRADSKSVSVGTNLMYAPYVILGTKPFPVRAQRRTLRFKVGKDGRSRFAKKRSANFEQDVNVGGYTHPGIPRRQVLGIGAVDQRVLVQMLTKYLEGQQQ